ncbi:type II toxin-antitoxin system prevent-host-death family antitoxin [Microbacterium horticulturae]|uniref:Antitoxin n=1 Tax=Microbacterium horticulturae TaxID=3028316 RepID=A0ABY8C0F6_9MICO|nr:type II toxin-antitoxin system prevent-host-death family antitoxin [Microbacterium sp. KACC 23027]WEG09936.1 type II toxin-antitoxin system prevent-host-death family antitoxin [Microbacterium sp. KACC 23027]
MSITVNVQEAKTRLSELLRRVESGDEVVIARAGRPIARIQATTPPRRVLDGPLLPEIPAIVADDLLTPMPEDDLAAWEDGEADDPLEPGAA